MRTHSHYLVFVVSCLGTTSPGSDVNDIEQSCATSSSLMSTCFKIVCANGLVPFLTILLLRAVCRTLNQVLGESDSFPLNIYATLNPSQLFHISQMSSLRLEGKLIHLQLVEQHGPATGFVDEDMLLIRSLCQSMGALRTLDMSDLEHASLMSTNGYALLAQCPTLQSLLISDSLSTRIDNDDLIVLSEISTLESINVCGSRNIGIDGLLHLAALPLKELHLQYANLAGDELDLLLAHLPNLKTLCLTTCPRLGWYNKHQVSVPSLETLRMNDVPTHLECISVFPGLQKLCLQSAGITDDQLHFLGSLPLTTLKLRHNPLRGDGLGHLNKMPLTKLDLSHCELNSLSALPPLGLRKLALSGNSGLGDESISLLWQRLPLLEVLELFGCRRVSHRGLRNVSTLLTNLDLRSCPRIGNKALFYLRRCKEMVHLFLGGTSVTDTGVSHLRSLSKLRYIHLSNCKDVSRKALSYLSTLPLSNLNLDNTSITKEDMAAYPNLSSICFDIMEFREAYVPEWNHRFVTQDDTAALIDAIVSNVTW